ncbi:hypothetical protein phytr_9290 [Candidatus Phycorickettsia trachydisci]|uniref:Uncharacterized protein n=1 Tax=Candidatus Phycorickettsia trachydisci TaxID=2115978 RepID=A0A2P1P9C3_9RICK|nr:ankyrin repeat domain-containing protein [Candidatus Phycorickettsia trachydisci]AVP87857.1 hypothetical protein phytr_9290 [Candidatus Phycorickettsia trachydisci]
MISSIDQFLNYEEKLNQYAEEEFNQQLDDTFVYVESKSKLHQLFRELQSKKQEHTESIEKEILELKAAGKDIDSNTSISLLHFVIAELLDNKLLKYLTLNNHEELGHVLAQAICYDNIEVVKWLLDNGVSPNAKDEDGYTMIQLAFWKGNSLEIVELLIDKGADINAPNVDGYTPLDGAALTHNIPIIELMIEYGAAITQHSISHVIYSNVQNETIKSQALLLMLGSSQGIKVDLSSDLIYQFFMNNHNIKSLFAIDGYESQKVIAKENIFKSLQDYAQDWDDQKALDMAQFVSTQEIETLDTDQNSNAKLTGDFDYDPATTA